MRVIKKILIDLDDVLGDCTGSAMRHMGLHDWQRGDHTIKDRDIFKMYKIKTGLDFTPQQFWQHFSRRWWAEMQTTLWCYDLIDLAVNYVGRDNVAILTTPTKSGDCLAGKMDWIELNMPDWMCRQYLMSPRKTFCASEGVVLIDDCTENVVDFTDAGGFGVLLPQPWNDARSEMGNELEYVKNKLDLYQNIR